MDITKLEALGLSPEMIRAIHELSVELDFPITWFVVGYHFRFEDKELWEEIIAHGSEIGNHTWKHSKLLKFSNANAHTQVRKTQEHIDEYLLESVTIAVNRRHDFGFVIQQVLTLG